LNPFTYPRGRRTLPGWEPLQQTVTLIIPKSEVHERPR
jgi:hypothetical protein